jgi:tetratricopeptide (TPR) repeat protein
MQRIYDPVEEKKDLAVRLIKNGYLIDASRVVDEILNVTHSDPETVYLKSLLLNTSGKKEEALTWAERSVELNPENYQYLMLKAKLLHNLSFYDECIETLNEVYRINSRNTEALELMADILLRMGKPGEAYKMAMRSISILPSSWNAHFILSKYFQCQKMEKQSLKELDIAIRFNPESKVLILEKIRRLIKAKNLSGAEKELNRKGFMEINAPFNEILVEIEFLIENNFFTKADELCSKAISVWPNENLLYFSMGEICYNTSRKEESLSYFNRAFSMEKNEWYLIRLTTILFELEKYNEVTKLYDKGRKIPKECIKIVMDSFIKTKDVDGIIVSVRYNLDYIENTDMLFIIENSVDNNLVNIVLELGLILRNSQKFAFYVTHLRNRIIKSNDRVQIGNSKNRFYNFPYLILKKLFKGEFSNIETEIYLFSPHDSNDEKWLSILFYFARLNQYGSKTTATELHLLNLKYGSEYVSTALDFLKLISKIKKL